MNSHFDIRFFRAKDGDTFVGLVTFRLSDVDAVELKNPVTGRLSPEGLQAKTDLIEALKGKTLKGRVVAADKYGRALVALEPPLLLPSDFPYGGRSVELPPNLSPNPSKRPKKAAIAPKDERNAPEGVKPAPKPKPLTRRQKTVLNAPKLKKP